MAAAAGPRARFREQTRTEIKDIALRQLAAGGTDGIALTRIAKELGMSGPALYRYFASRDDLLSVLIRDAYDDLATAIENAVAAGPGSGSPRARLHALAGAFRAWAVGQPHRYLLIAGTPVPGYTAPPDTLLRARAALGPFMEAFVHGRPNAEMLTLVSQMDAWAKADTAVADWVAEHTGPWDPPDSSDSHDGAATALAGAVLTWSQMHGAVSLEVSSQFSGMGHSPSTLLRASLDALADAFGLPAA
ncbi:TetR/AcrR family transcriptional regulator [Streptomyces sp. H10-C2]|uniref:TetR/AcrR family transcriptional regulator n=1 Tax=unclassified Streptomyces TaxID=2593676 RepID=UPI0024BA2B22|nr:MULTISPECIES: TetR/AcrR family transcriptional regulator [unclassified Streptomyces]MDJ0345590.1 TetR/AcrR family transcriptional regulator [Streptomyces sp. PH10-H1]MDJ0371397.1 TetR/AcrR family transcriptional regulator [Streptomyces sp. H10-C2]